MNTKVFREKRRQTVMAIVNQDDYLKKWSEPHKIKKDEYEDKKCDNCVLKECDNIDQKIKARKYQKEKFVLKLKQTYSSDVRAKKPPQENESAEK